MSEIDFDRIYQVVDDIETYFGSDRMAEFNYTLDSNNTSFEELMRMIASATCSHDRRVGRKIYYDLEGADNDPIILFNHRNKAPNSETRAYNLRNSNDGVELTYVDSDNGWVEKTLKVPNDLITNPKRLMALELFTLNKLTLLHGANGINSNIAVLQFNSLVTVSLTWFSVVTAF